MFITFEGGEGSGKSTQAKKLYAKLQEMGRKVILTREPGGTPLAENLREILLSKNSISDPLTELLIISAARRDHVETKIKPAISEGITVISDRFFDSSIAYQSFVKGLPIGALKEVIKISIGDFEPNLTFVIDIDPEIANERIKNFRASEQNHYDHMGLEFHKKIRNAFLEIAKMYPKRIIVINGNNSEEAIHQEVLSHLA